MPFTLNVYLPSTGKEVQIKELCYRQYRELVKSLYSTNKKETIQQYNSILLDLCPDIKNLNITFEDKLALLLTVRNYCVSPDLKLKGTTADGNVFNFNIAVETLIQLTKSLNKSGAVIESDIRVEYSSYKVKDEHVFIGNNKDIFVKLASHIDCIVYNNTRLDFKDLSLEERLKVVNGLPHFIFNKVHESILETEFQLAKIPFLTVVNPITEEVVLTITNNINFESLQKLIEFAFTEELNNIYRAFYNMVKYAGYSAEYIDSITPVEMQVYWMYYNQDLESSKNNNQNTGALPSSLNTELGF
jgi:hypothetical protein